MKKLIFVYNADSGRLNALGHTLHKLISPATYKCRLCSLSHSWFSERTGWQRFVGGLGLECEFFHRDEFLDKYTEANDVTYPAIFIEDGGELTVLISPIEFNRIHEIDELRVLLQSKLAVVGIGGPK